MTETNKTGVYIVSIVAIVAVLAIIFLIIATTKTTPTVEKQQTDISGAARAINYDMGSTCPPGSTSPCDGNAQAGDACTRNDREGSSGTCRRTTIGGATSAPYTVCMCS